jgi:hypothetical protein
MVPPHLTPLTQEQRDDLRLWHGRITLYDRIKGMRGYAAFTLAWYVMGITAFVVGVEEGIPPMVLAPIIPLYMTTKLWKRGTSLRAMGLRLRRVLLMPRAKWVLPAPPLATNDKQLEKLAPREVLDSPEGAVIRRAVSDRVAILDIASKLPKADRSMIPDLVPTVNALVERVAHLAQMLHRLDQSVDQGLVEELQARIAEASKERESPEGERRIALLRRQRDTFEELAQRRAALARQLESAGLALGNLRLDLIKLRSSGLQSALSDVSTATQEARALSREIDTVLEAADEMRKM